MSFTGFRSDISLWALAASLKKSKDDRSDCSSFPLILPKIFGSYWILLQYEENFAALYYCAAGILPARSSCALCFIPSKLACCPYWMSTLWGMWKDTMSHNNGVRLHNKTECFSYKNCEYWSEILLVLTASFFPLVINSRLAHKMR